MNEREPRRRFLCPEVVQTSAMDCGPAALKAVLEGFGVAVSYGRLREACRTDVDGSSIDTLEDLAQKLGLDAVQEMVPVDHLLLREAALLPAIVVVELEAGFTHFVVVWRRHGAWLQVMDPSVGRRWVHRRRFLEEVYVHEQQVPAAAWLEWATGDDGLREPLRARLAALGVGDAEARRLFDGARAQATADEQEGWRALARLDGATRFASELVEAGALSRGAGVAAFVAGVTPPDHCGSALPLPAAPDARLRMRGAVLLRLRGRKADAAGNVPASAELDAALREAPQRPWRTLTRFATAGSLPAAACVVVGILAAAVGVVGEGLLLRALLEVGDDLKLSRQRFAAVGLLLAFFAALLLLDLGIAAGLRRLARRLELRLRTEFLAKLARLEDRYFQSRPLSDMAERSHALHQVREFPRLLGDGARAGASLLLTTAAIAWLTPRLALDAAAVAAAAIVVPWIFATRLNERDLRVRTKVGALCRFSLDALLGLAPIQAHGAQRPLEREHAGALVEWFSAARAALRATLALGAAELVVGFGGAALLLFRFVATGGEPTVALLLGWWALSLPSFGEELVRVQRQLALQRSLTLRLLEPLGAPERDEPADAAATAPAPKPSSEPTGIALRFEQVDVVLGGQAVLQEIDLEIAAGAEVAIVGASGAGKSSLLGVLLGWHRCARGRLLCDGVPLTTAGLAALRRATIWVDPAVQLWNRSLLDNLLYGNDGDGGSAPLDVGAILAGAELAQVVDRLPDGMATPLGEGGGLLSGGQGQRVRFGRALGRVAPRLALLDEPFRGLDAPQRRSLLAQARRRFAGSTLLCVTHHVGETLDFERVLVLDGGRVVEDGSPAELRARPASRYRALLDAEQALKAELWNPRRWRPLRLEDGVLLAPDRGASAGP